MRDAGKRRARRAPGGLDGTRWPQRGDRSRARRTARAELAGEIEPPSRPPIRRRCCWRASVAGSCGARSRCCRGPSGGRRCCAFTVSCRFRRWRRVSERPRSPRGRASSARSPACARASDRCARCSWCRGRRPRSWRRRWSRSVAGATQPARDGGRRCRQRAPGGRPMRLIAHPRGGDGGRRQGGQGRGEPRPPKRARTSRPIRRCSVSSSTTTRSSRDVLGPDDTDLEHAAGGSTVVHRDPAAFRAGDGQVAGGILGRGIPGVTQTITGEPRGGLNRSGAPRATCLPGMKALVRPLLAPGDAGRRRLLVRRGQADARRRRRYGNGRRERRDRGTGAAVAAARPERRYGRLVSPDGRRERAGVERPTRRPGPAAAARRTARPTLRSSRASSSRRTSRGSPPSTARSTRGRGARRSPATPAPGSPTAIRAWGRRSPGA